MKIKGKHVSLLLNYNPKEDGGMAGKNIYLLF